MRCIQFVLTQVEVSVLELGAACQQDSQGESVCVADTLLLASIWGACDGDQDMYTPCC